jgi:hypothetical protein
VSAIRLKKCKIDKVSETRFELVCSSATHYQLAKKNSPENHLNRNRKKKFAEKKLKTKLHLQLLLCIVILISCTECMKFDYLKIRKKRCLEYFGKVKMDIEATNRLSNKTVHLLTTQMYLMYFKV